MTYTLKGTFPSKSEAEIAMRRMSYPAMEVYYSKKMRGWAIRYSAA